MASSWPSSYSPCGTWSSSRELSRRGSLPGGRVTQERRTSRQRSDCTMRHSANRSVPARETRRGLERGRGVASRPVLRTSRRSVAPRCRPYRTVFEPWESRKPPEVNLLDTLLAHYDELDRGKTYPKVAWEPKLGFY